MRTLILTLVGLSTLGELAALAAPPSLRRHHKHLAPMQHPSLRVRGGHAPPLEAGVDTELASKVLKTAMQKAFKGGVTGSIAGVAQVFSFMWLRTAMNYQYANGGNGTLSTVATLYEEGGLPRLYRGVQYALVQNPLSRFGDAAANAAVPALVVSLVPGCVEIKILRRPPRYRRDACSMLWRYRFPTARRNQDGSVIAEM